MPDKTQAQQILDDLDPVLSKNPNVRSASVVETEDGMEVRIPVVTGTAVQIDSGTLVTKLMEVHKGIKNTDHAFGVDWSGYMVDAGVGLTFYTEWSRAEDVDAFYEFGWFRGDARFTLALIDHESHDRIKVWDMGVDPSVRKIMKQVFQYENKSTYKAPVE